MRLSASRSPASRRRRRFSALSASNSGLGTKTMSSACATCELLTITRLFSGESNAGLAYWIFARFGTVVGTPHSGTAPPRPILDLFYNN
jgi:hypothetical protein